MLIEWNLLPLILQMNPTKRLSSSRWEDFMAAGISILFR